MCMLVPIIELQTLAELKGETDKTTIIVGDFTTALIAIKKPTRLKKISIDKEDLNTVSHNNWYLENSKCSNSRIHIIFT